MKVYSVRSLVFAYCLLPILFLALISTPTLLPAQVTIGDSLKTAHPSAELEVFSDSKGFLPPRLTTAQRDSIDNPADGLIVYDTDLNKLLYFHNDTWKDFGLWSTRDSTSGNIFYNGGRAAIGPGSDTIILHATLNITGSAGIVTDIVADTAREALNAFIAQLDHAGEFNGHLAISTTQTNNTEGGVVGMFSYLESDAKGSVAMGGQSFYTGAGGDLDNFQEIPIVMGSMTDAYVLDTLAEVLAIGSNSIAESAHKGINIGNYSSAVSPVTYANIGVLAEAGDSSSNPIIFVRDSFPNRFTAAALLRNFNNTATDFNVFAAGEAHSYFGGNVGIGTLSPESRLHVAGKATIDDSLFVSNGYISVGGLPLKKTGGAINLGDTALVEKLKITESPCDGCVLTSDTAGVASWETPVYLHKTVSISSSQILNIATTPVVLVAAPGSGKVIVPMKVILRYTFGTTAYSGTGTAAHRAEIRLRNGASGSNGTLFFRGSNTWSATSSYTMEILPQPYTSGITDPSGKNQLVENDDLILSNASGSNNPTTGDGTMEVEVFYMIIPY